MEPTLDLQSQFLLLFFRSIGGSKDLFYFYFPFEEDYHDITFILPLNGYYAYISRDTWFFIQYQRYFLRLGCSPVVFTEVGVA